MATNNAPVITLEGDLDAVVVNGNSNNVSVLIGNGAGGFTAATPVDVGDSPRSVALGDVDGDGALDALVANTYGNNVSVLLGNGAGGFTAATPAGVGTHPISVALGDVNGDGHLDALVANSTSNNVSVLLGNGAGGFTAATPVGAGTGPFSVALGDLNGDGHLDALVVNTRGNNVSVLIGDGAGGFTAATPVGVGNFPATVALGDVDGDGDLDALVTNRTSDTVSVLLGNGAGGFTATTVSVSTSPVSVALGDVNGDGHLDALVAHSRSGIDGVLIGNGTGGFTTTTAAGFGAVPYSVALGDVDGDGHLDALVANFSGNNVSVLLGDGAGHFTAAPTVGVGTGPLSVALGDLNNAQITDEDTPFVFNAAHGNALSLSDDGGGDETLTLAAQEGSLTLATHAGLTSVSGDGTHAVTFTGTVAEINAALNGLSYAPDANVNGHDTLTITADDNASAAAGGPLTATKLVPIIVNAVDDPAVLSADVRNLTEGNTAADISSSGTLTISDVDSPATFVAQAGTVGLYGTFAITSAGAWTYTASSAHNEFVGGTTYTDTFAVASADGTPTSVTINILGTNDAPAITLEGHLDAVVANRTGNSVSVLIGDGAGGFTATPVGVGTRPYSVALGDVNGDGILDALVANNGLGGNSGNVSVLLGDGAGGFTAAPAVGVGTNPASVALGDVNGDGHLDALVANLNSSNVSVLIGNGAGGFTAATPVGVGSAPVFVALGDVNSDGHLDALVANLFSNNVSVLLGNGVGGFTATTVGVGTRPGSVALGDVNGDGHLDALVANHGSNNVSVLLGDGAGGFTAATPVGVGAFPSSIALGDVNGDGDLDALVANANSNTVSVLLGDGAGGFTATTIGAVSSPLSVALADVDGDGHLDALVANYSSSNNVSVLLGDGAGGFTAATTVGTGTGPSFIALGDLNNAQITNEDTPFVFNAANGNALTLSDADGGDETLTLAAQDGKLTLATHAGLTSVSGDGTHAVTFTGTVAEINAALNGLSYAPDQNVNGHDTLTITADDNASAAAGGPLTATKLVPIIVNAVNDPAVLSADVRNLTEGNTAAAISSSGTLTISDVDSPATFAAQTGTAGLYGTFAINSAGAWTYTASSAHNEFVGGTTYTDTFSVASADGTSTSVTINILGINDPAVLSADVRNLTEGNTAAAISGSGTLTISDVDSPATFAAQTGTVGSFGTFAITSAGAWTYTASSAHNEFVGGTTYTDTFAVASADGTPTSVTINILGTNDPAVLSADVRNLTETDAAAAISSSGTLTISDVDSPATFAAQTGTAGLYGTFAITSAGAWTYTATSAHNEFVAGTTYTDTFSVASADGTPTSVTIHILGTDDPTVAQGDAYTLAVDAPLDVAAPGVLANDSDAEGALSAHLVAGPLHDSSFIFNPDGSFEYMPEPTFFGDDTFTYRATAGGHDSADVVDTIHVTRPFAKVVTTDSHGNTTSTTYDSKGNQPWSTQSFTTDNAGHFTDTTVTYRDGTVQGSVFDTTGQPWSQQNYVLDAQGHVTNASVFYDDGTKQAAIFDTDGQPWSQQNFVFDAQGHVTNYSVFNDDGTVQGTTYDTTGQPWSQQNYAKNPKGELTSSSVFYDDGSIQSTFFDTTGQPWSQQNYAKNPKGELTSSSVLYDDGSIQSTIFDTTGQPWSQQTVLTNSRGQVTDYGVFYDDGSIQSAIFDTTGQPWSQQNFVTNPQGVLTGFSVFYDDGSIQVLL